MKNAARKCDSLQVDFLARCSRALPRLTLQPLISPGKGHPPFVVAPRELTFGPPPNEATRDYSKRCATVFFRASTGDAIPLRAVRTRCDVQKATDAPVDFGLLVPKYPLSLRRSEARHSTALCAMPARCFGDFGALLARLVSIKIVTRWST